MRNESFGRDLERAMFSLGIGPLDGAVIFGSAVMKLHGLREDIGDVDLFVPPASWARLRGSQTWSEQRPAEYDPPFLEATGFRPPRSKPFHAFYAWTSRDRWMDVPDAVSTAERVCGVLCVRLELVARWKRIALARCLGNGMEIRGSAMEKHAHDLWLLTDALGGELR